VQSSMAHADNVEQTRVVEQFAQEKRRWRSLDGHEGLRRPELPTQPPLVHSISPGRLN